MSAHVREFCLLLQDLFAAGEGKFGTDEETLMKIIGNRSAEHLRKGEHLIVPSSWCIGLRWGWICNLSVGEYNQQTVTIAHVVSSSKHFWQVLEGVQTKCENSWLHD